MNTKKTKFYIATHSGDSVKGAGTLRTETGGNRCHNINPQNIIVLELRGQDDAEGQRLHDGRLLLLARTVH